MSLFQKKSPTTDRQQYYSLSASQSFLIVGLGNPGDEYKGTRHNLGFSVIDSFATNNDFGLWSEKKHLKCQLSQKVMSGKRVILIKPSTFMNLSGEAVQAVQHFYRLSNQQTLVIHDELAVPFTSLRTRVGGSDAGHNGVKSIITHCRPDFARLRIGIGQPVASEAESADFVLGKFTSEEREKLSDIIREAEVLITEFLFDGRTTPQTRTV